MPDPIVVSIASIPRRSALLARVVATLLPQCDRLNVFLNGYATVPGFLTHDKIAVARSGEHGDRGDAGKFWWSDKLEGAVYHFTADDDLAYPSDYCKTLVAKIESLRRRAVVGVHGVVLPTQVVGRYYGNRRVYPCLGHLAHDTACHLLGTGALAYHSSTIIVKPSAFARPNMADIWFGIIAKKQKIPMICIGHASGWLVDLGDPRPDQTIHATRNSHNAVQGAALATCNPWPPPLTVNGIRLGTLRHAQARVGAGVVGLTRQNPNSGRSFGAHKIGEGAAANRGVRKR